ncbi:MAG: hypothetical protein NT079_06880, partial [Candidatus Omnitrophica bacterium]|nr:hypothetical protein [Candidatus Omnitrophota bacterium]
PVDIPSLVPERFELAPKVKEDIIALGKGPIRWLIRAWRAEAKKLGETIKEMGFEYDLLVHGSISDLAGGFEDPGDIEIAHHERLRTIVPVDQASLSRTFGSTTFTKCGWCSHAYGTMCTLGRGTFCSEPKCYFVVHAKAPGFGSLGLDSDCVIKQLLSGPANELAEMLKDEMDKVKTAKKLMDTNARFLRECEDQAENKPCLPAFRPADWFKDGDQVVYYVERTFLAGRVIQSTHKHEFEVAVHHRGEYKGVRQYSCWDPRLLEAWELVYLRTKPGFTLLWSCGSSSYGLDLGEFRADLVTK